MNILVTGVTGYIGSRLAPRLRDDGHAVRGLSRGRGASPSGVEVIAGDAFSGAGLERAMDGIDVAYYLIHSMETGSNGSLASRERRCAENFARATAAAGVPRGVYLGGLIPAGGPASAHLASRLAVERVLQAATPCPVALRASIVIGAGSRPFRILVRLVERMPVLVLPGWHSNRTRPIDERDVIELLARAAISESACGDPLDAAGPEALSYGELIRRIRDHLLLDRPTVSFRSLTATPLVSRIASNLTGEEHELVGPLMESLRTDLLPRQRTAEVVLGVKLHSLNAAIEHALREWETAEPLAAR
ncbi:MAG: NAD(P)H-binding protein [Actinomycetota bacterium]|nr:NAD(P)H-binding protein [Actinomycetota bacterium]